MNKKSTTAETATTARFKGRVAPVTMVAAVRTLSAAAVCVFAYLLAFAAAIRGVPLIFSFVASGTGVTNEAPIGVIVGFWFAPAAFLAALVFVGVLGIIRWAWRLRTRLSKRFQAWALGTAPDDGDALGGPGVAKSPRNRDNGKTSRKTA